jgi:hypothetical protein
LFLMLFFCYFISRAHYYSVLWYSNSWIAFIDNCASSSLAS